jgi:hypothetical protein
MRKWDDPPSPFADPAHDSPPEDEPVRHRARAFRRWLARGADPGGLRAFAGEQPGGPDAAREHAAVRDLLGSAAPTKRTFARRTP